MLMRKSIRRAPVYVRRRLEAVGLSVLALQWTNDRTRWWAQLDLTSPPAELIRALLRSDPALYVWSSRSDLRVLEVAFYFEQED